VKKIIFFEKVLYISNRKLDFETIVCFIPM